MRNSIVQKEKRTIETKKMHLWKMFCVDKIHKFVVVSKFQQLLFDDYSRLNLVKFWVKHGHSL